MKTKYIQNDGENSPRRIRPWNALAGMGLALFLSGCAVVPPADYPKHIPGVWQNRTYGFFFDTDGSALQFNPRDGVVLDKGRWSLAGDQLSLRWERLPNSRQARIKFLNPNVWEWTSGRR